MTEILSVIRKPALENWFKYNTAEFCNQESARGKKIGTTIHEVIQSYIETGTAKIETEYPDEVTNALKSFMLFKNDHPGIILQRSEMPLTSEKYEFNGTIDCIGQAGGEAILCDWKSGNAKEELFPVIYPEHRWQVSSYFYLYNEKNPQSPIESAIIVSVAKDRVGYDTFRLNQDQMAIYFNEVFLPALKICNHQRKEKENVRA